MGAWCLLCADPAPVSAKTEKTVAHPAARVFPAAVRFLRIDERLAVVEKDPEAGYVLFELRQDGKTFPGALELVAVESNGRSAVRLVLRIEDRPSYVEAAMIERLERKLRAELGRETAKPVGKSTSPRGDDEPKPPADTDAPRGT